MLKARSPFRAHAKHRAISPPPPSRQGRLFPLCRGSPLISFIRVATIPNITVQPLIPVTGVNDRNVTQNPYHHVHSLCSRPLIWIGDALQKRFVIQQSSI